MKYLIWSEEHKAWWKAEKFGYTRSLREAGRYELEEGLKIVEGANKHLKPGEQRLAYLIPDPASDAAEIF
jgi:hypothetical protein